MDREPSRNPDEPSSSQPDQSAGAPCDTEGEATAVSDTAAGTTDGRDQPTLELSAESVDALQRSVGQGPAALTDETDDAWEDYDDDAGRSWLPLTAEADAARDAAPTGVHVLPGAEPDPSAAGPSARFVGIAGADEGSRFSIDEREVTVGRASGCSVRLRDPSASREHARLLFDGDRYVLIDNRSANGTYVNGKRTDRTRLVSGDTVGFGQGRYQFLVIAAGVEVADPPAQPQPEPSSPAPVSQPLAAKATSTKKILGVAGIALLVAGAAAVAILRSTGLGGASEQTREAAFEQLTQGIEAFKARRWDAAEKHFQDVLALVPSHGRAQQYLQQIVRERGAAQQLQTVRTRRDAGDLQQAYSLALALRDTAYRPEARALVRAIESDLDARIGEARRALARGRSEEAVRVLASVEQVRPDWPSLAPLKTRAAMAREGLKHADAPRPAADDTPTATRPTAVRTGGVAERARALLEFGEPHSALEILAASAGDARAAALHEQVKRFVDSYEAGLREHRAKRARGAIELLSQARSLLHAIVPGASVLSAEMGRKLADMHYVAGVEAHLEDDVAEAFERFSEALSLCPDHRHSRRRLDEMRARAETLLSEASAIAKTDPAGARDRLQRVLKTTKSDDRLHRRAKHRLRALR